MTDIDLFSRRFRLFLDRSSINIEFENQPPPQWRREDILLTMMIAIRSPVDVLTGVYSSYEAFISHINSLNIVEDLISQRGVTVDEDLYDALLLQSIRTGIEFFYANLIPRASRHRDHYMAFMKALGLCTQEDYLLTRGWFCRNADLQRMTLQVVLRGYGHQVDVKAPDYREHITSLLPET